MKKFLLLLKKFFNILVFRRTWSIGYRIAGSRPFSFDEERRYHVIEPSLRWWYADPFCIKIDDRYYIFCEMLDSFSGRGSIGVFEYSGGVVSGVRQVLREPFHLSYPNVFHYKNEYYMIPESGDARQVRLYKALEFPYRWELDSILLEGRRIVDSTLLTAGDKTYLFAYDLTEGYGKLDIYYFDIDKRLLLKTGGNSFIDKEKQMRPAGNFLHIDGRLVRPAQYSSDHYGAKILFNAVEKMPDDGYGESGISELSLSDIKVSSRRKYTRIHTINRHSGMEVVDLFSVSFCPVKPFFLFVKMTGMLAERIKDGKRN
jgi:hypothetical protein